MRLKCSHGHFSFKLSFLFQIKFLNNKHLPSLFLNSVLFDPLSHLPQFTSLSRFGSTVFFLLFWGKWQNDENSHLKCQLNFPQVSQNNDLLDRRPLGWHRTMSTVSSVFLLLVQNLVLFEISEQPSRQVHDHQPPDSDEWTQQRQRRAFQSAPAPGRHFRFLDFLFLDFLCLDFLFFDSCYQTACSSTSFSWSSWSSLPVPKLPVIWILFLNFLFLGIWFDTCLRTAALWIF